MMVKRDLNSKERKGEFICSECGLIVRDLVEVRVDEDNEDECYFEFEFKFCPNCGRRVVE